MTENQHKVEKNNGDFPHVDCEEADCDWWGQFIRFYRRVSVHRFSNEHPHVEQGLARSKASYHVGTGRHQNKENSIFMVKVGVNVGVKVGVKGGVKYQRALSHLTTQRCRIWRGIR